MLDQVETGRSRLRHPYWTGLTGRVQAKEWLSARVGDSPATRELDTQCSIGLGDAKRARRVERRMRKASIVMD